MKRRSKFDIVIAILEVVSNGTTKTKNIYNANLNFNLAKKYLDFLLEKGLVRTNGSRYEITGKGKTVLENAKELQKWTVMHHASGQAWSPRLKSIDITNGSSLATVLAAGVTTMLLAREQRLRYESKVTEKK
jgi:predicted transcriptional regulator